MTRVAIVTTSYPSHPGDPSGHFVETEAKLLARAGHVVTVLAPGRGLSARHSLDVRWLPGGDAFGWPGALERLRERPLRALHAGAFMMTARRELARLNAERVVAHWIVPSAWPIAARAETLEVVAHGSDVALLERLPALTRSAIVGSLLHGGARFRFVSRRLLDRLAAITTPALRERSRVQPSPIDVDGAPTRSEARARLAVHEGERLAVIVGRLVASKRPEAAVDLAFAHAADRVVVVGDGPLAARLRRPRVHLAGRLRREEALTWISAADLLVSASRSEGAPTVVREARALGVPVIAVPCGDLGDWAREDAGISLVRDVV